MIFSAVMWVGRTYIEGLMTSFYRFLARFSGRRRGGHMRPLTMRVSFLPIVSLLALHFITPIVEGCSSRSTPKPRPPPVPSTSRPNVTFHTYACPPDHAAYYCLNGATCFTAKIGESWIPYCECADGFMGERCEFKDLDGTYLSSRRRVMLETASIASGATVAVFLVVVICMFVYVRVQRKNKQNLSASGDMREDLEKRGVAPREGHIPYSVHHVSTERGTGDNISLAVYNTDPP
ncbi:protein spitz isoform X2 [Halyomorpha halys]|uniref:protein spitz isoform X2 n=1 Tax=Halyomorpha halys TaxID=286706 RepID=UPI0006D4DD84|nr:protein spitz-like [Halyomorpha halys]